jgi:pteridine reductase
VQGDTTDDAPVALVTGAAVRLGRAIATGLSRAGYRVWIHHHRSGDSAMALHESLQHEPAHVPSLGCIAADLVDPRERQALATRVLDPEGPARGRLDLFVASAASFERGAFVDRSDADLERVLALCLVAPLSLDRAFASELSARGGTIVHLLDLGAFDPWPEYLDHCVAKAGLHAATRALAVELAPVRVNAVAPGPILPPEGLHADALAELTRRVPAGHLGDPEDVVDAVTFLARARHVTGHTLVVDGGQRAALAGPRPRAPGRSPARGGREG